MVRMCRRFWRPGGGRQTCNIYETCAYAAGDEWHRIHVGNCHIKRGLYHHNQSYKMREAYISQNKLQFYTRGCNKAILRLPMVYNKNDASTAARITSITCAVDLYGVSPL